MEKSSSLSALRQRVRDGVAESDFAGWLGWSPIVECGRQLPQTRSVVPIWRRCGRMAWRRHRGLIFSVGWSGGAQRCPQRIMPWAFCMRTGFACPGMCTWPATICSRAGRRSIRRWAALPVGGCFRPLHRTPCWPAPPPERTGPNSPWPHGGGNKMERKALMKSGTSGRMWASGPTFL